MSDPHFLRYARFLPADLAGPVVEPHTDWMDLGDGTTLHLFRHPSPVTHGAACVVLHGAGGHGRMLAGFGSVAQRLGASCVSPDLPGYGHTVVPDPQSVTYQDWVEAATALTESEFERTGTPVVVIGGSMGGRLAVDVAHRLGDKVGAVIATCLLDPRQPNVQAHLSHHPLLIRWGLPAMRATQRLSDRLLVPIRWLAPINDIANDPELAALCKEDPLGAGRRVPIGFFRSWIDYAPDYEPETFGACTVILAHPGEDRWTPLELSKQWFDRLDVDKELTILKRCGHAPVERPGVHELANVIERALATAAA